MEYVLCTGGAGYIGSHCAYALSQLNYNVLVADNLSTSSPKIADRLSKLSAGKITSINIDLTDCEAVRKLFREYSILAVIHLAAFKAVGDSVRNPLKYYHNNIVSSLCLLEAMRSSNCRTLVYSSSATVYKPHSRPLTENSPLGPSNPYGHTKAMTEQILRDLYISDATWKIVSLRYFNPVGAHSSGELGELPRCPENLFPVIMEVVSGKRSKVTVFGNDWDTIDGTGVRDYLHIEDLADGHAAALNYLLAQKAGLYDTFNLGTGCGVSVLQMIDHVAKVTGFSIPYEIGPRSGLATLNYVIIKS